MDNASENNNVISVFEFAEEKGVELTEEQTAYIFSKITNKNVFIHITDEDREIADDIYHKYKETFNL